LTLSCAIAVETIQELFGYDLQTWRNNQIENIVEAYEQKLTEQDDEELFGDELETWREEEIERRLKQREDEEQ
jgi:hypothetical protein